MSHHAPNKHTTKLKVFITNGTWTKSDRLRVYGEERGDWKQLEACRDKHLSHLFFSKMIRNIEDSSVVNSSCRGYIRLEEVFYQEYLSYRGFVVLPKTTSYSYYLHKYLVLQKYFNIECYGCLKGIEQIRLILNILTIELLL